MTLWGGRGPERLERGCRRAHRFGLTSCCGALSTVNAVNLMWRSPTAGCLRCLPSCDVLLASCNRPISTNCSPASHSSRWSPVSGWRCGRERQGGGRRGQAAEALADTLGPDGISVDAALPVPAFLLRCTPGIGAAVEGFRRRTPLRSLGRPEETALGVAFPRGLSGCVTGTLLVVLVLVLVLVVGGGGLTAVIRPAAHPVRPVLPMSRPCTTTTDPAQGERP